MNILNIVALIVALSFGLAGVIFLVISIFLLKRRNMEIFGASKDIENTYDTKAITMFLGILYLIVALVFIIVSILILNFGAKYLFPILLPTLFIIAICSSLAPWWVFTIRHFMRTE